MKHRRTIASTPQRTAKATWARIIQLISAQDSVDTAQLEAARAVAEASIADECPTKDPIVVSGNGPRLVIYLVYDQDALEAGDAVDELTWNPTGGDWSISLPADERDVAWMCKALATCAPRFSVRKLGEPVSEDESNASGVSALTIDWSALS